MAIARVTATAFRVAAVAILWILVLPYHNAGAFVRNDPQTLREMPTRSTLVRPERPWVLVPPTPSVSQHTTCLFMGGIVDSFMSRFRNNDDDEGDFVKLEKMNDQFVGPGPVVLLYKVPQGIDDQEIRDMLEDGAPQATSQGISIARISDIATSDLMDKSLEEALTTAMKRPPAAATNAVSSKVSFAAPTTEGSPVVIFSGFSNAEMMASYNILGEQVYMETAGTGTTGKGQYLACATAVPNAMNKSLRQVLSEISGDHQAAMGENE